MHHPQSPRLGLVLSAATLMLIGCGEPPEPAQVSFNGDVQPILQTHCVDCHTPAEAGDADADAGKGYRQSGLSMASYEALMDGTLNDGVRAPVVIPGSAINSVLIQLVEGRADPSLQMPHGDSKLADSEIATLRAWVEQGAPDN